MSASDAAPPPPPLCEQPHPPAAFPVAGPPSGESLPVPTGLALVPPGPPFPGEPPRCWRHRCRRWRRRLRWRHRCPLSRRPCCSANTAARTGRSAATAATAARAARAAHSAAPCPGRARTIDGRRGPQLIGAEVRRSAREAVVEADDHHPLVDGSAPAASCRSTTGLGG